MVDRYEYDNLSEKSKEILIKELNENQDQVNAHIESFRRWVNSMHHLKCPTDSKFLIKFLRVAKFDHKKAQRRLDNFCTARDSPRGSPQFFQFYKYSDPILEKVMNLRQQIPLGKCDNGEFVVLVRPKAWNPDEIPVEQVVRYMYMELDCMMEDETYQIHGMMVLIDLADVSRKSFEVWGDPKLSRQLMRTMQDALPVRIKAQIFYNEPVIFDIVLNVMSFFMNEKMRKRVLRIKKDIKKAMEKIPGLKRILPTEYGGGGGTVEECFQRWKSKVEDYFKDGNPLECIKVDESKRPKETLGYLNEYSEYKGATLGTPGTYTKYDNVY